MKGDKGPYKFTPKKRDRFLGCLRQGMRRGAAARAAGVTRQAVAAHARHDPDFASAVEQAELDACEIVEDALFSKAREGNVTAIQVWLYNRSPARWQDRRGQAVIVPAQDPQASALAEILARLRARTPGAVD